MERIRRMLVELMPGYTIRTLETNKKDKKDRALKREFRHIFANMSDNRIIYLIHITGYSKFARKMFGAITNEFSFIRIKHIGRVMHLKLDITKEVLKRDLERMTEANGQPECNICMEPGSTCSCNSGCTYEICYKCLTSLIIKAIAIDKTNIIECPQCRGQFRGYRSCDNLSTNTMLAALSWFVANRIKQKTMPPEVAERLFAELGELQK